MFCSLYTCIFPIFYLHFSGCYWHACKKCYPIQHVHVENDARFGMRRDSDFIRFQRIQEAGYNLIKIWECDFTTEIKSNHEMRDFIKTLKHLGQDKLEIRDAYFGGRTNATKLYHDCQEGEKIRYIDVCSLYPYVLKYFPMPIGVPKILIGDDLINRSVEDIEGIIKCKVLPPKQLYHPVLPTKMHGRLMFILCYTCAKKKNKASCSHSDEQRSFVGTYVSHELQLAINKGYKVIEIYEAWEYEVIKYDKESGEKGLFSEYVDAFLKMKAEASGYPDWVQTQADKEKYISDYLRDEGIQLDADKIESNPGLRTLAKALLNYLYGKFGERSDKLKKVIVNTRAQVVALMSNPLNEVQAMFEMSDDAAMFTYKNLKEADKDAPYVNVAIAAYTTAHARTVLYKYLNILNEAVLYFDTDSIIYLETADTPKIKTGDLLGDMTDELAGFGKNAYITTFVSGGPKNYAFKVRSDDKDDVTVCKVKGIRLNYMNSQVINFDTIKELLFSTMDNQEDDVRNKIELKNKVILRQTNNIVYTTERKYNYKINVTKRRRLSVNPLHTLPFGHT